MPIIPFLDAPTGDVSPSAPSIGGAMAAGNALAKVGGAVSGVGEDISHVVVKQQEQNNQDAVNTARLSYQEAVDGHNQFRAENPDENTWAADAQKRFGAVRDSYKDAKISGHAREQLDAQVKGWETSFQSGTAADARNQWRSKARTRNTRLVEAYKRAGKFDDAGRQLDEGEKMGLFATGELDPDRQELATEAKAHTEQKAYEADLGVIASNPRQWRLNNPKPNEGEDPVVFARKDAYARQQANAEQSDLIQSVREGMLSSDGNPAKILKPEDIDHYTEDASPVVRDMLKQELRDLNDSNVKAERGTPKYQQQTVGQVSDMLKDYEPSKDEWDEQAVKMDSMIRTLPESAAKDELSRLFQAKRKGETGIRNHGDAAQAALEEAFKAGRFGKIPERSEVSTMDVARSGFLRDVDKLQRLGFSAKQAATIRSAGEGDPAAGQKAFIDTWKERPKGSVLATGPELEAADALRLGKATVPWNTGPSDSDITSAKMQAQLNYGRAKIKLADYLKLNPKASPADIDQKVFEIAGEEARKSAASGKWDPAPVRGGATSGNRITSYGYIGDSTPDGNSKVGIGAWVSDTEAEQIRRGQDTPNKLKPGDLAVSRDVEAQFQEAGIKPGDTVTLNLADGSTRQVRWMDRTAADFKGKTLTNRFDLYSPDGKSPLDGTSVTGWNKTHAH